jgi:hypothetical protein
MNFQNINWFLNKLIVTLIINVKLTQKQNSFTFKKPLEVTAMKTF